MIRIGESPGGIIPINGQVSGNPQSGLMICGEQEPFLEQPESRKFHYLPDRTIELVRVFKCFESKVGSIPPLGSESVFPSWFTGTLCDVEIAPEKPGRIGTIQGGDAMVTATLTWLGYQTSSYPLPSTYELQVSTMERPIAIHPDFMNDSIFPKDCKMFERKNCVDSLNKTLTAVVFTGFKNFRFTVNGVEEPVENSKFRGVEAFLVGTLVWKRTSMLNAQDIGRESFDDVGKRQKPTNPTNLKLPDEGEVVSDSLNSHWLKTEHAPKNMFKNIHKLWEVTEAWKWNELSWMKEVYKSTAPRMGDFK